MLVLLAFFRRVLASHAALAAENALLRHQLAVLQRSVNDSIFGEAVNRCLSAMGITQVRTSLGSPWQNAYAERVIGTIRRECLDHVIVLNEAHLIRVADQFVTYCYEARCHQSLDRDSPNGRTPDLPGDGAIIAEPMVGGLHHRYRRAA